MVQDAVNPQYKKIILVIFSLIVALVFVVHSSPNHEKVLLALLGKDLEAVILNTEGTRFSVDSDYFYELDFSMQTKKQLMEFLERRSFKKASSSQGRYFSSTMSKKQKFKGYVLYRADIVLPIVSNNKKLSVSLFFHKGDMHLPVFIKIVEF